MKANKRYLWPFLLIIVLFQVPDIEAQIFSPEVIASAGNSIDIGEYNYSWTVGETAILTLEGSNLSALQGFHQPDYFFDVKNIDVYHANHALLYPNPTSGFIRVEFSKEAIELDYLIFDLAGNKIVENKLPDSKKLNLVELQSGCYLLVLKDRRGLVFGKYSVIKI